MLLTLKKSVQKIKYSFGKKIKSAFKCPKSLKMAKGTFDKSLKMKFFLKSYF
jgi:hypothetical protein